MKAPKKRINSKNKGSTYEREIVNMFKDLGYVKAKTSRATSKLLDDCKIDINFIPYLVQTKCGYPTVRPKYEVLKKECIELINKHFPEDEAQKLLEKPYVLFHKLKGKNEIVSIDRNLFMDFVVCKDFKEFCEAQFPEILKSYHDSRIL